MERSSAFARSDWSGDASPVSRVQPWRTAPTVQTERDTKVQRQMARLPAYESQHLHPRVRKPTKGLARSGDPGPPRLALDRLMDLLVRRERAASIPRLRTRRPQRLPCRPPRSSDCHRRRHPARDPECRRRLARGLARPAPVWSRPPAPPATLSTAAAPANGEALPGKPAPGAAVTPPRVRRRPTRPLVEVYDSEG
jgi:hypothetical protein